MAPEPNTRDTKLIQYLNEAYGKEKELETALKAHLSLASRDAYKKRLREHLKETQQQAKGLERRIKQLGGKADAVSLPGPEVASKAASAAVAAANKGAALAKGPLHAIRGTGEAETQLKNAKTELFNEYEEIGTYLAIEELAAAVKDRDTAKLAREYRRQEERMASFLLKLIPQLSKQVARDEIPAAERKPAAKPAAKRKTAATKPRAAASSRTSTAKPAAKRATATKPAAKRTTAAAKPAAAKRTTTAAKPAASKPAAKRATASKPTAKRTTAASKPAAKRTTTATKPAAAKRATASTPRRRAATKASS